jgi:hypothetical protein
MGLEFEKRDMKSELSKLILFFGAIIVCATSCADTPANDKKLPYYDLASPEKFIMPESLLEISGISFHLGKSDTIYAIQDEEGKLFHLSWGVKKQYHSKFGKQGDYEDVTIYKENVVVLKSNGVLYSFPFADTKYQELDSVKEWKRLLPKGEYEGMYGDEATNDLYVLCKKCDEDRSKNTVTGFVLTLGDSAHVKSTFTISVEEAKEGGSKAKRGFRPSALAKNPISNEWYIVSAVNQLLVVTDENWKVVDTYRLSTNLFNQPEGIAFDNEGNLYISNEGDDLVAGNILKFRRASQK